MSVCTSFPYFKIFKCRVDRSASGYITLLDSALRKTLKSRKGSFEWNLVYNLHTYLHYLCSTQVGPFHYQIRNTGATVGGAPPEYKLQLESDYHRIPSKKYHPISDAIKLTARRPTKCTEQSKKCYEVVCLVNTFLF